MTELTVSIPDDIIQKLEEQEQPLQTLLLQALNDYFQKSSKIAARTETSGEVHIGGMHNAAEIHKATSDGQRMAEALSQIAGTSSLTDLDPIAWQKEIRGDRPLPNRD